MPKGPQGQINREELLKARERVNRQLSIGSVYRSGGGETARAKLLIILQEIEAELAEMESKDA